MEAGPAATRLGERVLEMLAALRQVGAVDREAGEQLCDRVDDVSATLALVDGHREDAAGARRGTGAARRR